MALVAQTKPKYGNLVKHEYATEHGYCREKYTVNLAADTDLVIGDLLGKVTASGKYVLVDPTAVDGSEVVAGVVLENKSVLATTDTEVVTMVRGNAIIADNAIVYTNTFDANQKAQAIAEIESLGIVVRQQV